MDFLKLIWHELITFFALHDILSIVKSGDYGALHTLKGLQALVVPLIPLLLIIELIRALVYKRFHVIDYKVQFYTYVFNRLIAQFISLTLVGFSIGLFQKNAIIKTSFTWYWLIYSYIVWEFSHFIYHYLAHKVRLLWCLHSTHHAPQAMNLAVAHAHFALEAPYADLIRTSICILFGVNPVVLFFIFFVDGTWGTFIHAGENILRDGRLGFMKNIILTPSHHRVHHAKNPMYMDTNFCNLLNIWDRIFGTYINENREMPVEYGITRKMNPGSFTDCYFGEFIALWKDIKNAPRLKNKLQYLIMPPGWSHTGEDKTAKKMRNDFLKNYRDQSIVNGINL